MARVRFYDYVENGHNRIREWLDTLSPGDQERINTRLRTMEQLDQQLWSDKWIKDYKTTELFELRIKGSVQFRPLGRYDGAGRFVILGPAVEKGGKLKPGDVGTAESRSERLRKDPRHAQLHQFDDDPDMEEVAE